MAKNSDKNIGKTILKILGWLNIITIVLFAILAIVTFTNKSTDLINSMTEAINYTDNNGNIFLGTIFTIAAVISAIETWLIFRAAKDAKKSTFLLVLTILSVVTTIVGWISTKSVTGISAFVWDMILLISVLYVRSKNN